MIDAHVPCHSCTYNNAPTGHDSHGNVCPRCHGSGERDATEAAAELAMLRKHTLLDGAAQALGAAGQRWYAQALAEYRAAHDAWEAELTRLAAAKSRAAR